MKRQNKRQTSQRVGEGALLLPKAGDDRPVKAADGPEGFLPFLRRHQWIWGLFLMAAIMIAYQPIWHAGFIWDDDEAIIQFQQALAIQPGLVDAQNSLAHIAWVLATSPDSSGRNGTKAVELAQQTDRLSGGTNPAMAATLAAAYAEAGQFPEAITNAQRAVQLAARQNNVALISAFKAQLKLYQAGSPFQN